MKSTTFSPLLTALIIFGAVTVSFADTIHLTDRMVLTGKVISETDEAIEFGNSYGTFTVQKKDIRKIYVTDSYKEDMKILKRLRQRINEKSIRKNVLAGVKIINEGGSGSGSVSGDDKKKKDTKAAQGNNTPWNYGRLVISGSYFSTFMSTYGQQYRKINSILPSGIGAELAYEQGLDFQKKKKKDSLLRTNTSVKKNNCGIPALRIAFGYLYFTNDIINDKTLEVSGYTAEAGLIWAFPSPTSKWGCFTLGAMGGLGFLDIINRETDRKRWSYTPAATAFFGYEYYIKVVSLVFQLRYTYLYDSKVAFHGLGGTFGLSFKLW